MQEITSENQEYAACVGRYAPLHIGHQVMFDYGFRVYPGRQLTILGSRDAPQSLRHLFSYEDRSEFIRGVYPQARIVGIPDYPTDDAWFDRLDEELEREGIDPARVTFLGGCKEDISFFLERNRRVKIFNRFNGETPKISATEVRDALVSGRSLEGLVAPQIQKLVRTRFAQRWEEFCRKEES